MQLPSKRDLFAYAVLLAGLILGSITYTDFAEGAHHRSFGDAINYITMSEQPFAAVSNPFALRILSPGIVHAITNATPLGTNAAWLLLTLVSSYACLVIFFKMLSSHFKLHYGTSLIATLFLLYTYNYIHFNLFDFWLVDPLNNLAYMAAFWFLFKRMPLAFYVTILLGAMNKETTIFLLPLYPLTLIATGWKVTKTREFWVSITAAVIVIAGYLLMREWAVSQIQAHNPGASYSPLTGSGGNTAKENIAFSLSTQKSQHLLYLVLDFLWLFGAYAAYLFVKSGRATHPLIVATLYLIPVCFFGRFFATDVARIFVMMAPLVIVLVAHYLDMFREEEQQKWMLALLFIYACSSMDWVDTNTKVLLQVAALAIFALRFSTGKKIAVHA